MTTFQPSPDQEIVTNTPRICPFIGIRGDATTYSQFPSRQNHCHVPVHPEPIQPDHQRAYCLTTEHLQCPVYRQEGAVNLPPELRRENPAQPVLRKWIVWLLSLIGFVALMVLLTFLIRPLSNPLPFSSINPLHPTETNPPIPTLLPTPSPLSNIPTQPVVLNAPSQTPTPSPSLYVRASPSHTHTPMTPTVTPTFFPTPGPGLGTPFGTTPQYLIHVVQAGESFTSISAKHGTTVEVLQALNILVEGQSLWEGRLIVVPLGAVTDPEGLLKFRVYLVPENTTLSQVAALFNADPKQIRSANALGPQPEIPAGRWLIIPVQ